MIYLSSGKAQDILNKLTNFIIFLSLWKPIVALKTSYEIIHRLSTTVTFRHPDHNLWLSSEQFTTFAGRQAVLSWIICSFIQ